MNAIRTEVLQDLRLMKKIQTYCEDTLPTLPDGSLNVKVSNGSEQYYHILHRPGQPSAQIYLRKNQQHLVSQLKHKTYLKKLHKVIAANINASEKFLSSYQSWDADDIMAFLPQGHRTPPAKVRSKSFASAFSENLKFETAAGIKVRSKSEVIIADALFMSGIDFKYEEPSDFGLFPDFTITLGGKAFIWEHFGLLSDEAYQRRTLAKLSVYQQNGFVPGHNLIMSFDRPDGIISSREIFTLIQIYLLKDHK